MRSQSTISSRGADVLPCNASRLAAAVPEARVIVCVCFNVSDRRVRERARDGVSLHAVLEETRAGSACGSCKLAIARVHKGEVVAGPPCRAARDAAA